ncbi:glycoside hydrolase family 71 protein [Streptomyces sp. NPDC058646]|uniref:glycoside hydrolase family 71 protein n=1 Tax=Streptomyces sp. NPDC058646 TaxID=3346574 RepID=UPI00364F526B
MTADRRADRRAEPGTDGRTDRRAGRRTAGRRAARPSHRRRPGFRGRRTLLATAISVFLLVGVCAATGIAWDPFGGASAQAGPPPGADAPLLPGPTAEASPAPSGPVTPQPSQSPQPPGGAADGGSEGAGEPAAERPTGALPFDMPQPAALRSGEAGRKLVFAHYFTPYPLSLDNVGAEADYYTRNYLNPDGESGKHEKYGGLLRDRPLPVPPKSGNWELANLQQEVRTARAAGIDGFTLDMLSLSGKNWERSTLLMEAARSVDPAFKIMLMPDMTSLKTDDPGVLADAVAALGKSPAAHRLADGRLVVSPFKAEAKSVAWWTGVMDALTSRHGIRTAFVPLFLDFHANSTDFAQISYGFSEWGSRSYVGQDSAARDIRRAHGMGKIWMQPVSVQDVRPNQGIYDEAGNTATLRSTWKHAIDDGADWVQLTTWNDYSESTQFAPSLHNGYAYLDLTSYYLTRFKTGSWPKIVRDTLYLTARTQFAAADPTGDQSLVMSLRKGSAAPRDTVEVLSFLAAPGVVRTTVGSVKASHDAPAGLHAELLPLKAGTSSAQVVRDGRTKAQVELPYPVDHKVEVQDLQYYAATSGREAPAAR